MTKRSEHRVLQETAFSLFSPSKRTPDLNRCCNRWYQRSIRFRPITGREHFYSRGRCRNATAAGASFASETLCSSIGNFSEFSYRSTTLRGMRTAAYKVDVAMRPPQARVSQAKLFSCFDNFMTTTLHTHEKCSVYNTS